MTRGPTRLVRSAAPLSARAVVVALAGLVVGLLAVASHADAQLETGRAALAEADFERAERALSRALSADAITREELEEIFEGRAMTRWALGEEAGAIEDLRVLASLAPRHALPPEAPPALADAWSSVSREPLDVRLAWDEDEPSVGGRRAVHLHVEPVDDVGGLVRGVRIHWRRPDERGWLLREARDADFTLAQGDALEVWIELVGPGGAVVAEEGAAGAPVVYGRRTSDEAAPHDDTLLWVGVGAGVAILAIAIGVGVAVGTAGGDLTQPEAPVLVGF
ncbi:MAG: hypothetical protein K1X94_35675 [Sandaracinaceae bacterium]|nr:hypothetical protein [Sandaracinaceae bacterium]